MIIFETPPLMKKKKSLLRPSENYGAQLNALKENFFFKCSQIGSLTTYEELLIQQEVKRANCFVVFASFQRLLELGVDFFSERNFPLNRKEQFAGLPENLIGTSLQEKSC